MCACACIAVRVICNAGTTCVTLLMQTDHIAYHVTSIHRLMYYNSTLLQLAMQLQ
jgi:hypothetical protein